MQDSESLIARFEASYEPLPWSGCWIWDGQIAKNGYGRIQARYGRGGQDYAHRVSYRLFVGEIPEGLELDHKCRVRCCVNPAHLEPVTSAENTRRGLGGKLAAERHAARTHCANGHPRNETNTLVTVGRGGYTVRICRVCHRARAKAMYKPRPAGKEGDRTHCPLGHPYDDENTIWVINTRNRARRSRQCRACKLEASKRYHAKRTGHFPPCDLERGVA